MWRLFRIRKDRVFFLASLGIAVLAGVFALGYWYFVSPTTLMVAVGPRGGVEERLMRAFAQALVDQKRDVRLRVLPFDDVRKSAEALRREERILPSCARTCCCRTTAARLRSCATRR